MAGRPLNHCGALSYICAFFAVAGCALPAEAFMHLAVAAAITRTSRAPITSRPSKSARRLRNLAIMTSSSNDEVDVKSSPQLRYIDAGANLLDSMYQGTYHGKPRHEPDLDLVLRRAYDKGVDKIVSLAGTVDESKELMELIESLDAKAEGEGVQVFGTVGVHPTRCAEVFADKAPSPDGGGESTSWTPKTEQQQSEIIQELIQMATQGKETGSVVAIGEFGLDYARLHFAPKDMQQIGLRAQLQVACETKLPLYLHNRESGDDLYEILAEYKDRLGDDNGNIRGIVHSFDESIEIARQFLSLGLYIGINGCSLKTAGNLEVVKQIPLERLILETDCPWCEVRPSHASFEHVQTTFPTKKEKQYNRELGEEFCVKNRTEPCHVAQVADVLAGVKGVDVKVVVEVCCQNVFNLFGRLEKTR